MFAPSLHRCVFGQVCAVEVGECGEGLLFGLTGRAAVINQPALRKGGSAGETLLTSVEPVSGCVMGLTAASFPLPVPLDVSDDAVSEEETCFASR